MHRTIQDLFYRSDHGPDQDLDLGLLFDRPLRPKLEATFDPLRFLDRPDPEVQRQESALIVRRLLLETAGGFADSGASLQLREAAGCTDSGASEADGGNATSGGILAAPPSTIPLMLGGSRLRSQWQVNVASTAMQLSAGSDPTEGCVPHLPEVGQEVWREERAAIGSDGRRALTEDRLQAEGGLPAEGSPSGEEGASNWKRGLSPSPASAAEAAGQDDHSDAQATGNTSYDAHAPSPPFLPRSVPGQQSSEPLRCNSQAGTASSSSSGSSSGSRSSSALHSTEYSGARPADDVPSVGNLSGVASSGARPADVPCGVTDSGAKPADEPGLWPFGAETEGAEVLHLELWGQPWATAIREPIQPDPQPDSMTGGRLHALISLRNIPWAEAFRKAVSGAGGRGEAGVPATGRRIKVLVQEKVVAGLRDDAVLDARGECGGAG